MAGRRDLQLDAKDKICYGCCQTWLAIQYTLGIKTTESHVSKTPKALPLRATLESNGGIVVGSYEAKLLHHHGGRLGCKPHAATALRYRRCCRTIFRAPGGWQVAGAVFQPALAQLRRQRGRGQLHARGIHSEPHGSAVSIQPKWGDLTQTQRATPVAPTVPAS